MEEISTIPRGEWAKECLNFLYGVRRGRGGTDDFLWGMIFSGITQTKIRLKFVYSNRPINTWPRLWTEETREISALSQAILFLTS